MQVSHFVEHTKRLSPLELLSHAAGVGEAFQTWQSSTSQRLSRVLAALGFHWSPTGGRRARQTNCPIGEESKKARNQKQWQLGEAAGGAGAG